MKDWYIYQGGSSPAGPFTTELLARGILAGKVARDAYVACQGDPQWLGVMSVIDVVEALEAMEKSGAPVPPRPIHTIPPAPAPAADLKPEEFKPLFDPATVPDPVAMGGPAPVPPPKRLVLAPSQPLVPAPSSPPLAPLSSPAVSSPAPVPLAAAPSPPPAPEPGPSPARKAAEAPAENKDQAQALDPKYRAIPYAIFGACVLLSIIVYGASRFVGGAEPSVDEQGQGR